MPYRFYTWRTWLRGDMDESSLQNKKGKNKKNNLSRFTLQPEFEVIIHFVSALKEVFIVSNFYSFLFNCKIYCYVFELMFSLDISFEKSWKIVSVFKTFNEFQRYFDDFMYFLLVLFKRSVLKKKRHNSSLSWLKKY